MGRRLDRPARPESVASGADVRLVGVKRRVDPGGGGQAEGYFDNDYHNGEPVAVAVGHRGSLQHSSRQHLSGFEPTTSDPACRCSRQICLQAGQY